MGQGQSSDSAKFQKDFNNHYEVYQELSEHNIIYKCITQDLYVQCRSVWCNSEQEHRQFLNNLKSVQKFNNPNLISTLGFTEAERDFMCGEFHKVTSYQEYFMNDLQNEIKIRVQNMQYFTENEVYYILTTLTSIGSFMQQNNITHGDLRPVNIKLTPEGQLKVSDSVLFPEKNNLLKVMSNQDTNCYLAPEQLSYVGKQFNKKNEFNQVKADVFSLGMTLLECMTLQSSMGCYNLQNQVVKSSLINNILQKLGQSYSKNLLAIIGDMLLENPQDRPDFHHFKNSLSKLPLKVQSIQLFGRSQKMTQQVKPIVNVQQSVLQQSLNQSTKQQPINQSFQNDKPLPVQSANIRGSQTFQQEFEKPKPQQSANIKQSNQGSHLMQYPSQQVQPNPLQYQQQPTQQQIQQQPNYQLNGYTQNFMNTSYNQQRPELMDGLMRQSHRIQFPSDTMQSQQFLQQPLTQQYQSLQYDQQYLAPYQQVQPSKTQQNIQQPFQTQQFENYSQPQQSYMNYGSPSYDTNQKIAQQEQNLFYATHTSTSHQVNERMFDQGQQYPAQITSNLVKNSEFQSTNFTKIKQSDYILNDGMSEIDRKIQDAIRNTEATLNKFEQNNQGFKN